MGTTFRYNSALLPEYVTTIIISVLTTLIVMTDRELLLTHDNPHYSIASAIFAVLALLLVALTLRARWRWCTITVDDATVRGSLFAIPKFELPLSTVVSIKEEVARFYGRRARRLTIRSTRHDPVEIADFIYGYNHLERMLGERSGASVEPVAIAPEMMDKLRRRALKRHEVFGRPRPWRVLLSIPVKVVGLLPVLCVDLFFTLTVIFTFHGDSQARDPRAVYAGPISLAAAALAARYAYYPLASSIRLNRTVRVRRRAPVPPPLPRS
ncbi:MAG: hypothetical protein JW889_13235 [Verrucomicrobia bacterium]|nr:hypothetical protein [Verrucomicrobiota bacterium]